MVSSPMPVASDGALLPEIRIFEISPYPIHSNGVPNAFETTAFRHSAGCHYGLSQGPGAAVVLCRCENGFIDVQKLTCAQLMGPTRKTPMRC